MSLLNLGDEFSSFDDLSDKIAEFSESMFVNLFIFKSMSLTFYRNVHPTGRAEHSPSCLKYYSIKYRCKLCETSLNDSAGEQETVPTQPKSDELRFGSLFPSLEAIEAAVRLYETSLSCRLFKSDTMSIDKARQRGIKQPINDDFQYYMIKYGCMHGIQSSSKKVCPFLLKFKVSPDGKSFAIVHFEKNHNHACIGHKGKNGSEEQKETLVQSPINESHVFQISVKINATGDKLVIYDICKNHNHKVDKSLYQPNNTTSRPVKKKNSGSSRKNNDGKSSRVDKRRKIFKPVNCVLSTPQSSSSKKRKKPSASSDFRPNEKGGPCDTKLKKLCTEEIPLTATELFLQDGFNSKDEIPPVYLNGFSDHNPGVKTSTKSSKTSKAGSSKQKAEEAGRSKRKAEGADRSKRKAEEASKSKKKKIKHNREERYSNSSSFNNDWAQSLKVKRKDRKAVINAFQYDIRLSMMSMQDSLNSWIEMCSKLHDGDSPILYHDSRGDWSEFLLVIMTKCQKEILLSAKKQVICIDSIARRTGREFHVHVAYIFQEFGRVFPVAFCISHKTNKDVICQFFMSIKDRAGQQHFSYFMSNCDNVYYDIWKKVMQDESRKLYSQWDVDHRILLQFKSLSGDATQKNIIQGNLSRLMVCQDANEFDTLLDDFIDSLKANDNTKNLGFYMEKKFGWNTQCWAPCHRQNISVTEDASLEEMHEIFRFCIKMGKQHRLDKCIFALMMILRNKVIERLPITRDKIHLNKSIKTFHDLGVEKKSNCISSLGDDTWFVKLENETKNVYVNREFLACPEACDLKCAECNVCSHMFSCSCAENLMNASLCQHIHAVVWQFFKPEASKLNSLEGLQNLPQTDLDDLQKTSETVEEAMRMFSDLYSVRKRELKNDVIDSILKNLKKCRELCKDPN